MYTISGMELTLGYDDSQPNIFQIRCSVNVLAQESDILRTIYIGKEETAGPCDEFQEGNVHIQECNVSLSEIAEGDECFCKVSIVDEAELSTMVANRYRAEFTSEKIFFMSVIPQQENFRSKFIITLPSVGGFLLVVIGVLLIIVIVVAIKRRHRVPGQNNDGQLNQEDPQPGNRYQNRGKSTM